MTVGTAKMTIEEFLALPDEPGVRRELIRGELREERGEHLTTRSPRHAACAANFSAALRTWQQANAADRGFVGSGDIRCCLPDADSTLVGIDVALFVGDDILRQAAEESFIAAAPIIAVEVWSGSNTQDAVVEKIRLCLRAGVKQVWQADSSFRTVAVHRVGVQPVTFNANETLSGGNDLPGFSVPVASLFA
ncbi:MAG: Uma2 family endonuclease [Planctomycetaceae bacterium]|nr:Uma2 family endonuclease [Planctomycetaceae bacterium]